MVGKNCTARSRTIIRNIKKTAMALIDGHIAIHDALFYQMGNWERKHTAKCSIEDFTSPALNAAKNVWSDDTVEEIACLVHVCTRWMGNSDNEKRFKIKMTLVFVVTI